MFPKIMNVGVGPVLCGIVQVPVPDSARSSISNVHSIFSYNYSIYMSIATNRMNMKLFVDVNKQNLFTKFKQVGFLVTRKNIQNQALQYILPNSTHSVKIKF